VPRSYPHHDAYGRRLVTNGGGAACSSSMWLISASSSVLNSVGALTLPGRRLIFVWFEKNRGNSIRSPAAGSQKPRINLSKQPGAGRRERVDSTSIFVLMHEMFSALVG